MKPLNLKYQGGVALIIFVLMLMGIGGILFVGYSQGLLKQVELSKTEHNTRVLKEAKQALLQFAYNYPVTNGKGPGRLPCADTDNNGIPNTAFGTCAVEIGRLPWNQQNLNLYDIRDADGERLWYAVSENFATQTATILNSGTSGTITVRDQSGNIIYDGNNPGALTNYGVAAIIIAPGSITARNGVAQDRSIANADDPFDTMADTDPGIINAANYLDRLVGTEDNADYTQDPANDGFILGPVNIQSTDAINDQMIIITAAEVMDLAVKAVLPFYPDEINKYQQAIWGGTVADYRYPWLNAYADISNLAIYDTVPGETAGRVPFLNYYTDHDSHTVITDLIIDKDIDIDLADTSDGNDPGYINAFISAYYLSTQTLDISRANLSFKKETFDLSADNGTDNLGTLISKADGTTVVNTPISFSETLYFWDGCTQSGCFEPVDGWEVCPVNFGDERDCSKDEDSPYNFEPWDGDWEKHADISIRRVQLQLDLDADFEIGLVYPIPLAIIDAPVAPTATLNSRRKVRFVQFPIPLPPPLPLTTPITDLAVDVDGSIPDSADFIGITVDCSGDFYVGDTYDPLNCSPTISSSTTVNQLDITADYYPELPLWVSQNKWNDFVLMAYADGYKPGVTTGTCTPDVDLSTEAADDCIVLINAGVINNSIVSLLVIAGDGDFVDEGADNFSNDLHDIFETENYSGIGPYPGFGLIFDKNEDAVDGNSKDTILILDLL